MKQSIIDLLQSVSIILLAIARIKKHSVPTGRREQSGWNLVDVDDPNIETAVPTGVRDASGRVHRY